MKPSRGVNHLPGAGMPIIDNKVLTETPLRSSAPGFLKSFIGNRTRVILGFLFVGMGWLISASVQAQSVTYHSFFTKDLNQLNPVTAFSKSDRIYLYTVWTGLTGDHDLKVLWIRPDKKVQETTRLKVKVPPNTSNYNTWAWLSFKKGLLENLSTEGKFIGLWRVKLFLDEKFLMEYTMTVL
jgi:hypothetical protein